LPTLKIDWKNIKWAQYVKPYKELQSRAVCLWNIIKFSVADPDVGSIAFLTPGSGIRDRKYHDPRSGINISELSDSLATI
jgi:hypothetical protein